METDRRAGVVGLFIAIGAESPGMVNLCICLLPGRTIAQPDDGIKVRSRSFALTAGLKRRIDVGIQGSDCVLSEHTDDGVWFAS